MTRRLRVPSNLCIGMPATRACPFSIVFQTVGKSAPCRTASVHSRARSVAVSLNIQKYKRSDSWTSFDLDQCARKTRDSSLP